MGQPITRQCTSLSKEEILKKLENLILKKIISESSSSESSFEEIDKKIYEHLKFVEDALDLSDETLIPYLGKYDIKILCKLLNSKCLLKKEIGPPIKYFKSCREKIKSFDEKPAKIKASVDEKQCQVCGTSPCNCCKRCKNLKTLCICKVSDQFLQNIILIYFLLIKTCQI